MSNLKIMSFGFDANDCRFEFKRCLFEYKGREFMLYPGDSHYCHSFDTLVKGEEDTDQAFEILHEFLYLFGWANQCAFHFVGGSGVGPANRELLLKRTGPCYRHPRAFWTNIVSMFTMADPNTSEDFKKAISLYNDAKYTNDIFYRFLCLFKIIDLPVKGIKRNPAIWLADRQDRYVNSHKSVTKFLDQYPNIGKFLQDECRNAIMHVHRNQPSLSSVLTYSSEDYEKIMVACDMMLFFAHVFIEEEIGLPSRTAVNVILEEK